MQERKKDGVETKRREQGPGKETTQIYRKRAPWQKTRLGRSDGNKSKQKERRIVQVKPMRGGATQDVLAPDWYSHTAAGAKPEGAAD